MQKNLIAVINNDLLMISKNTPDCMVENNPVDGLEIVSSVITNYVTNDKRFIDAVGPQIAKQAKFNIKPICYECDDCAGANYILHVGMCIGKQETDFHYDYCMCDYSMTDGMECALFVLYNNSGKSQLMVVFETCGNGITSPKTFKNGTRQMEPNEKSLEEIFCEILSDGDLKVI